MGVGPKLSKRPYLWLFLFFLMTALSVPALVHAHLVFDDELRLDISQKSSTRYEIAWNGQKKPLEIVFPPDCTEVERLPQTDKFLHWTLECKSTLSGRQIAIDGLDIEMAETLVRVVLENGDVQVEILNSKKGAFTVQHVATTLQVAGT